MLRVHVIVVGCLLGLQFAQLGQHLLPGEGLTGVVALAGVGAGAHLCRLQFRLHRPIAFPVSSVTADARIGADERLGFGTVVCRDLNAPALTAQLSREHALLRPQRGAAPLADAEVAFPQAAVEGRPRRWCPVKKKQEDQ